MTGQVYNFPAERGDKNHLHVVVLELSGSKQFLVVPAFGADGHTVNEAIDAFKSLYVARDDQIYIEMDNARYIQFAPGYTGKLAYWVFAQARLHSNREVKRATYVGEMSKAGLYQIVGGMLDFADAVPDRISANQLKRLQKLHQKLKKDICEN